MAGLADLFTRPAPVDVAGTPFADQRSALAQLFLGQQTGPQVRDPATMGNDRWHFNSGGTAARTSDLMWDDALMSPGQRRAAEVMSSEPVSRLMMLANFLGPKAPTPAPKGIRAYHGSPHDFDRFDLSKIGTGEGAQAYGHGLYFAENEGVARGYRDALSGLNIGGKQLTTGMADDAFSATAMKAGGVPKETADFISTNLTDVLKGGFDIDSNVAALIAQKPGDSAFARAVQAAAEEAKTATRAPGRMYEVNIKADPQDFLDWDVPLSQQSEKVRKAFEGREIAPAYDYDPVSKKYVEAPLLNRTGAEAHNGLAEMLGRPYDKTKPHLREQLDPAKAAEVLREAGIPGIRYKDAGSRGAEGGTHNLVVFDDSLIEILRKYGLAGILAGGASVATPSQGDAAP